MDFDEHTPLFVISVAAELAGMHPQTLRQYDRMGLVQPDRQKDIAGNIGYTPERYHRGRVETRFSSWNKKLRA